MSADIFTPLQLAALLLGVGGVGGFLSGLLGVGGGLIFVPAFYFCMIHAGLSDAHAMHMAVATSLAVVLVTALSSAFWHHKKGGVDKAIVRRWSPFAVAGVVVGATFASSVDGHVLKTVFATATMLTAIYMIMSKEPADNQGHHRMPFWLQRAAAGAAGVLSAMIGVGGAMMNIPLMIYNGVPMRVAVGTGAVMGFFIACPAVVSYVLAGWPHMAELLPYSLGYVSLLALAVVVPASLLLSPLGVRASHALPRRFLRGVFSFMLVIMSIRMFMEL